MAKPVVLAVGDDPKVLRPVGWDLRPYPSLDEPLPNWRAKYRPPPFEWLPLDVGTQNGG